ncbi:C40 family peptidase [Yersinia similis]|uniref:C40 family peptidase n=1 Tax=Yersinia similis TaxID=367190 RepID=UPI0011A5221E|nr:C40 family peptidase [Yersinia similis]
MRLMLTLFVLLFTQLFLNLAHASPQAHSSVEQKKGHVSQASPDDRKKRKADKSTKRSKIATTKDATSKNALKKANEPRKAGNNKTSTNKVVRNKTASNKTISNKTPRDKTNSSQTTESKTAANKKGTSVRRTAKTPYGRHRNKSQGKASTELAANNKLKLSPAHKKRYQKAKQTAMSKLMKQVGKPYRWGGSSPNTGFDCSGLIYYAYKDVVKIKMPRTANEMYHLRDAAPVKRTELESGDLVFFNIANRGVADHVGIYLGNGKFIQSPRTGEEIRISMLNNDYWQDHYVGARRVVTPKTIR